MAGFYRTYIEDYATLTAPLVALTKKQAPAKPHWTVDCQRAFDKICDILCRRPVLLLPNLSQPFVLRSDASSVGIGAALLQDGSDGTLHPVRYISRKLTDAERNYSTTERECLALVWAIHKCQKYLHGKMFIVQTDHRPLAVLNRQTSLANGRLQRWSLLLNDFTFSIEPISGSSNLMADCLSRLC